MNHRDRRDGHALSGAVTGIVAGAAGTAALNIVTYADMALRGRPASEVPTKTAEGIAERAGVRRSRGENSPKRQQRFSGIGALMGYFTGLAVGCAYGLMAQRPTPGLPVPVAGLILGAAAMVASDVPATAVGATRPSEWNGSAWASDIIPHLVYGFVTAAAFERFASDRR